MSLLIREMKEKNSRLRDSRDLNCFGGQELVRSGPGEKASMHHPNDFSHYTHCFASLPTVGINLTI